MNEVEKRLTQLLKNSPMIFGSDTLEKLVNYLLENGVTIPIWIDTAERLPTEADADENGYVLVRTFVGMTYAVQHTLIRPNSDFYFKWTQMPKPLDEDMEDY